MNLRFIPERIQSPFLSSARRRDRGWLSGVRWIGTPLFLFGVTRLGIFLVAYLASVLVNEATNPPYHLRPPDNLLLDVFGSRWDTGFYVSIAEEGYRFQGVPLPSVAFFPLLPLLIRGGALLVGDAVLAGVLISNGALLLATLLLYRLAADSWGHRVAERTVWYLLIFPTAFFGAALYTESLFLLLAVGSFYLARRGLWESAGLLGLATALTRFTGLILAPVLLVEWLDRWSQARQGRGRRPPLWALLTPGLVPLGTLAYMAYLDRVFDDPLAFVHGAAAWGREPRSPLETVAELFRQPAEGWGQALLAGRVHVDNWMDFLLVLLFLGLGLVLLGRKRWSEATFVLLGAAIPFSSGLLMSQRRYVWVLFPAFILLAQWGERPWVDRLITTLSLLGLALFTALFANGYWVG